ncbi:MAG: hypothetical protein K2O55_05055, partial [Alistipes sp.]|nr:hypothetical protein [Alistipes sp.]
MPLLTDLLPAGVRARIGTHVGADDAAPPGSPPQKPGREPTEVLVFRCTVFPGDTVDFFDVYLKIKRNEKPFQTPVR